MPRDDRPLGPRRAGSVNPREPGSCCKPASFLPPGVSPWSRPPVRLCSAVVLLLDTGRAADVAGKSPGRSEVGCLARAASARSSWSSTLGRGGRPVGRGPARRSRACWRRSAQSRAQECPDADRPLCQRPGPLRRLPAVGLSVPRPPSGALCGPRGPGVDTGAGGCPAGSWGRLSRPMSFPPGGVSTRCPAHPLAQNQAPCGGAGSAEGTGMARG